ncbi:hypothetical protein LINPERHAP2_LOCUS37121 [Linum perenne]
MNPLAYPSSLQLDVMLVGEHPYKLNDMEWLQAHRHVLIGANEVSPFLQEFQAITKH